MEEITNTPATGGTDIGENTLKEKATSSDIASPVGPTSTATTTEQTPEQIARTKAYDAERIAQEANGRFWNTCTTTVKIAGWFVGVGVAVLGIFYGYKINSISEPIGGIKADVVNLKTDNQRIESRIDQLTAQIDSLKDILIGRSQTR